MLKNFNCTAFQASSIKAYAPALIPVSSFGPGAKKQVPSHYFGKTVSLNLLPSQASISTTGFFASVN
jgi:hypothetical protein